MTDEVNQGPDKERMLKDVQQKLGSTQKESVINQQDQEALSSLVKQKIGYVEDAPAEPQKPVTKITHHEIKAMKVVSQKVEEPKAQMAKGFAQAFGQFFDGFFGMFATRKTRDNIHCRTFGHECAHCGAKIPMQLPTGDKK